MDNIYKTSNTSVGNKTSNTSETCDNLSQETLDFLDNLNHEFTLNTIPLQLFYVFLIVFGISGNILVIYIYGKKLQKVRSLLKYISHTNALGNSCITKTDTRRW